MWIVRERFNIALVIPVAHRGMVLEDLLGEIERARLEYIAGVKMRKLKAAREALARAGRYHPVAYLRERLAKGQTRQLTGNSAHRTYLKASGSSVTIDEAALKEDERYDGKYVLSTNTRLDPEEVVSSYKSLWQVEERVQGVEERAGPKTRVSLDGDQDLGACDGVLPSTGS